MDDLYADVDVCEELDGDLEEKKIYKSVVAAVAYIDDNFKSDISLEDIAAYVGYSRCYFSSMFKRYRGMSPIDYISAKRIEYAAALIRETSLPIFKIATECGFNNAVNFCRVFKKIMKAPPSAFRERTR